MMQVRSAEARDEAWLLEQLRAFSAALGGKHPLFHEPYAREGIRRLVSDHLVLLAEEGTGRAGFIAGLIGVHPFNPTLQTLSEVFWWVDVAHRRSRAGLLLLEAFLAEGRARADWILLSLVDASPVREDTLRRRGFRLQERGYLLEV